MKAITQISRSDVDSQTKGAKQDPVVVASERWCRLRYVTKRLTMWAYNHSFISLRLTQHIFASFDLRDV